jgi:hypothetical protein
VSAEKALFMRLKLKGKLSWAVLRTAADEQNSVFRPLSAAGCFFLNQQIASGCELSHTGKLIRPHHSGYRHQIGRRTTNSECIPRKVSRVCPAGNATGKSFREDKIESSDLTTYDFQWQPEPVSIRRIP